MVDPNQERTARELRVLVVDDDRDTTDTILLRLKEGDAIQNESLEMAQVASLVLALAPGKSAKELQAEVLALIDATRSINWVTAEEREQAQKYEARLKRLLLELASGNEGAGAQPTGPDGPADLR